MNSGNVFPRSTTATVSSSAERALFGRPRSSTYRKAVKQCLDQLKDRTGYTWKDLAEILGCSDRALRNAADEEGATENLNVITLLNIAYEFGEEAIAPVRALYLCSHAEPKSLTERLDEHEANWRELRREVGA